MGHAISGLIGREGTFRGLARAAISREPRAPLAEGWAFVPLDHRNLDALLAPDLRDAAPGFTHLTPSLLDAVLRWSVAGGLAYVETEYFGGVGVQGAVAAHGGRVLFGPRGRCADAINRALAALGFVVPTGTAPRRDAFDVLGLGRHRDNEGFRGAA